MNNEREDKNTGSQQPSPPELRDELKRTANELGGGLLRGLREGGKRYAEQQAERRKDWERRRTLTRSEWLLCLLLPPLGLWRLWKHRAEIKQNYTFLAATSGLITLSAGCFLGLMMWIAIFDKVEDFQRSRDRAREEQVAARQQEEVLPGYEEKLQEAIDAYASGESQRADQAFFELVRYVDSVEETAPEAYYSHGWGRRRAEAILGRSAAVLASGESQAASALIEQAIDSYSSPSFPVASARGEQLLRATIERREQEARERDPEWQRNEFNRRMNEAAVDRIRRGY